MNSDDLLSQDLLKQVGHELTKLLTIKLDSFISEIVFEANASDAVSPSSPFLFLPSIPSPEIVSNEFAHLSYLFFEGVRVTQKTLFVRLKN